MPAVRLKSGQATVVPRFAAIGEYASDGSMVRHVALAHEDCELNEPGPIPAAQVQPPLTVGPDAHVDVMGHADLTPTEVQDIALWIERVVSLRDDAESLTRWDSRRFLLWEYIALPAHEVVRDESGRVLHHRFSHLRRPRLRPQLRRQSRGAAAVRAAATPQPEPARPR